MSLYKSEYFRLSNFMTWWVSADLNNPVFSIRIKVLLRHKDLSIASLSNTLEGISVLTNDKSYIFIWNPHIWNWTRERILFSNMNLGVWCPPMFSYNLIYHFLCSLILFWWTFYKYISQVATFNLFFSNLNFSPAFHLQLSNSITTFTNNKAYTVIGDWNDIGIRGGWAIRSHHTVVHWLVGLLNWIIDLLSYYELLFSNLSPRSIICRNDSLNGVLCSPHTICWISDNEHMLIILIIWLWGWTLFLWTLTSD
jgi:hypothetical protein